MAKDFQDGNFFPSCSSIQTKDLLGKGGREKEEVSMKRRLLASLLMVILLLSLTACGGGGNAKSEEAMDMATTGSAAMDDAAMEMGYSDIMVEESVETVEAESAAGNTNPAVTGQKLIRTAWLELESTEFDQAAQGLKDLTEECGGYFETSSVANHKNGARWGDYTIRIPAERFEAFLTQAGSLCHLTWQEVTQDDVSEAYYDTEGRLKTQQIKLERLQALLSKAEVMEDIITLESAISETEWQIENLSGTLRHYDGKVNYATVHVNLSEVYKLSSVEAVPDTFGQRMGAAFGDGWSNFLDGMEDLIVTLAYGWVWLILLVVIIVILVRVVRKRKGRILNLYKKKDDKRDGV